MSIKCQKWVLEHIDALTGLKSLDNRWRRIRGTVTILTRVIYVGERITLFSQISVSCKPSP
jgi:hypothetical protein